MLYYAVAFVIALGLVASAITLGVWFNRREGLQWDARPRQE